MTRNSGTGATSAARTRPAPGGESGSRSPTGRRVRCGTLWRGAMQFAVIHRRHHLRGRLPAGLGAHDLIIPVIPAMDTSLNLTAKRQAPIPF